MQRTAAANNLTLPLPSPEPSGPYSDGTTWTATTSWRLWRSVSH